MAKKEVKNKKDKTSFAKSFKAELKKVIWPTPKQLFNNTVAVLVIVVITALIVFVLDFTFEAINGFTVEKVKQFSNSNNTVAEESVSGENTSIEETDTDTQTDQTSVTEQVNENTDSEEIQENVQSVE